jgi:hypothetical protein
VRLHFPGHTVSRADVCEDYSAEGAFTSLQACIKAQKGAKVWSGYQMLPDDESLGKTWAVGTRGGLAFLRLYEAGKMRDRLHLCRPDWVRCELETRPHYAADKAFAASMEPLHFWGLSAWSSRVGAALTQVEVPRFESQHVPSPAGAFVYAARTFRRMWEEMIEAGEDIPRSMQQLWADDDAARERWAAAAKH